MAITYKTYNAPDSVVSEARRYVKMSPNLEHALQAAREIAELLTDNKSRAHTNHAAKLIALWIFDTRAEASRNDYIRAVHG